MHVFVYGTLTEPDQVREVVDSFVFVGPALLDGLHPVDGRFPTLAPQGETPGRLLRTDEIAALDRYERVSEGLYVRVSVPLDGTDRGRDSSGHPSVTPPEATLYIGDPTRLGADVTWPGEGTFEDRVRRYVADNDVRVTSIEGSEGRTRTHD